jgi:hypothetical protein
MPMDGKHPFVSGDDVPKKDISDLKISSQWLVL